MRPQYISDSRARSLAVDGYARSAYTLEGEYLGHATLERYVDALEGRPVMVLPAVGDRYRHGPTCLPSGDGPGPVVVGHEVTTRNGRTMVTLATLAEDSPQVRATEYAPEAVCVTAWDVAPLTSLERAHEVAAAAWSEQERHRENLERLSRTLQEQHAWTADQLTAAGLPTPQTRYTVHTRVPAVLDLTLTQYATDPQQAATLEPARLIRALAPGLDDLSNAGVDVHDWRLGDLEVTNVTPQD